MTISQQELHHDPVKILWTGGWDSTFQLLHLVLIEKRSVQPFYLIDESRRSVSTELLTMKRIRMEIRKMDESAASLIQKTCLFLVSDIPAYPEISDAFHAIRSESYIGLQYDWFARFCELHGIKDLQLCIHKDDKAAVVVSPMVLFFDDGNRQFTIDERYAGTNVHILFKYFYFPLLDMTKKDMAHAAHEHGWSHIMEMTWFCHKPRNGEPCGKCSPCKYTIEEGFANRIPVRNRFRANFHQFILKPVRGTTARLLQAIRGRS